MAGRTGVAEVTTRLREYIEREGLGPQDRLWPERELAAMVGCSRETVRRALRLLEGSGALWRHQGKGTFIGPPPISTSRPIERVLETASTSDLLNARLVYEPALAAAAAQSATAGDVERLRELARATGLARDWRAYERYDDAFHKAVAHATGNPLLVAIFVTLASVRGRAPWQRKHDVLFRVAGKQEYATSQSKMHFAIVNAIIAHDSQAAQRAMSDHLQTIRDLVRQL